MYIDILSVLGVIRDKLFSITFRLFLLRKNTHTHTSTHTIIHHTALNYVTTYWPERENETRVYIGITNLGLTKRRMKTTKRKWYDITSKKGKSDIISYVRKERMISHPGMRRKIRERKMWKATPVTISLENNDLKFLKIIYIGNKVSF